MKTGEMPPLMDWMRPLDSNGLKRFIAHDEDRNSIYLFFAEGPTTSIPPCNGS
jgi:hypothetical protein